MCEVPSSPIFVSSSWAPTRWKRVNNLRSLSPRADSGVTRDRRSSLKVLDVKRQFHNKKRTKTTILTKDRRDRVVFPFALAVRKGGKEIVQRSQSGVFYTLSVAPLSRREALKRKPHTPKRLLEKGKKKETRSSKRVVQVGQPKIVRASRRNSPFLPKTKSFDSISSPPSSGIPTPSVARELKPVLPVKFGLSKPYSHTADGISVTGGKVGIHYSCDVDTESALLMMQDYVAKYSPSRDDFIVSFSSTTRRFHVFVSKKNRAFFVDAATGETVEEFRSSYEYAEYARSKRGSSFSSDLVNRFRASKGYCYLNHVWFLCLRAGVSFRSAFDYFWALGKNPVASLLRAHIAFYFGDAAASYHIAGWYVGKNRFHCDNRSRKFYTFDYLRHAAVGEDKTDEKEVELTPLSDAQRLKVLTQVHDNIRANRDSMLVKNLEVDLVDFFNSTKDIQRGKEKIFVPFALTETQQNRLLQGYPQFNIVFSNSSYSDHPMAAASRLLENRTLADFCGSHFADIGGCPLHHYHNSKTKRVHVCRPVLDAKDAQRRVLRNLQLKGCAKRSLDERSLNDNITVPSTHSSCTLNMSDCEYNCDYMMMVQVYDVELETLCLSMIKRRASVCYLTMITPGEVIDRRETFHHDILNCDISIDSGNNCIAYKFGSSCYTHRLSTIERYMTTPSIVISNNLFSVEMISERCGVNYYVVTRSSVCPAMACTKVLRYKRCCEGLVRVKLPRFCKKTRKCLPGIEYIYVDTDFVERIYQYVIGNCGVVNSKTFEWTWNYVKSSKSRVVISGKMIHRDVCISVDHMESFVVVMLAAGVRSRLASEYLAKNVSLYAGDASITDIISFSLREKYTDLKRNIYQAVSNMLKDMFSDVLLMQFLDLDDALTYFEPYSEVTVQINECGFGYIRSDEIEELIASKCSSDITTSVAAKAVAPYVCPANRVNSASKKVEPARGGGLYAGAHERFSITDLSDMMKAVAVICPSFLSHSFEVLRSFFKNACEKGKKFWGKCRMLYEAVLSLGSTFSWSATKTREILVRTFSEVTEKSFSFSSSFVNLVAKNLSSLRVGCEWLFGVVSSYARAVNVSSSRSVNVLVTRLEEYISLIKNFSIFDFREHLPFETAVSIVERFVLDFPLVCKGELSLSDVMFRCLYNVVLEINISAITTVALGPCDTLKKDMFVRAFSSVVAGSYFTPFTFSPETVLRLSTLLPMVIRKLLVAFFDSDFSFYVGQVQYAVDDLSAFSYIRLKYNEYLFSSISTLLERFDDFLRYNLECAVNHSASLVSKKLSSSYPVSKGKDISKFLKNGFSRVKKCVRRAIPSRDYDDETDYYSDEDSLSSADYSQSGLRGGGRTPSGMIRLSKRLYKYIAGLVNNIRESFSSAFLLTPAFNRLSTVACDLLSGFGDRLHRSYEDFCLSSSPLARFVHNGVAYDLTLRRDRAVPRAPDSVTARGAVTTFLWNIHHVSTYFVNYFCVKENFLHSLPYMIGGGAYFYYNPVYACFAVAGYIAKFFVCDRFNIVIVNISSVGNVDNGGVTEVSGCELLEWSPGCSDDADSDSDVFFTEFDVSNESPGLRGGGRTLSIFFRLFRFLLHTGKNVLFNSSFFPLFKYFFFGSLVDALVRSKWASRKSRAFGILIAAVAPKSLVLPMCLAWRDVSPNRVGVKSLLGKCKFLSEYFERRLLSPKIKFSSVVSTSPEYSEVRTLASVRTAVRSGSIADSFSDLEAFKSAVKNAVAQVTSESKPFKDVDSTSENPDEENYDWAPPVENVCELNKNTDATPSSICSVEHPQTERVQLLPLMDSVISNVVGERESLDTGAILANGSKGLCKYLQSLNLHVTAPRPYIPASKKESHSTCTNAIREFYFLNEVELFSLYTKLFSYFEQLKVARFDRSLCECDVDEDLFVFQVSKAAYAPKKGVRLPKDLTSHEMMFTSSGMVANDPKTICDKILHTSSAFVPSNRFLLACESHSSVTFTNTDVKIILYEAPPGGGKTTTLIDLMMDSSKQLECLVLTANKNSQLDIKEKISKRFSKSPSDVYRSDLSKQVLTIDSYLMNHYGRKCAVLFVDECFMVHSGQVLAAMNATNCSRCILFGDSRQIHYIQRNEITSSFFGDLDIFVSKDARIYGSVSYRCPWDVCEWLSKVYKNTIRSNNSQTVGKTSVNLVQIEGFESVPVLSGVKYITYTQGEKNELQRYISKKLPKSVVNTVHEVQGETFNRVALVRTKYQEDSPFVSQNHVVVALSRHVESLHYYVLSNRNYDDTSNAIRDMMQISERYKTYPKSFGGSDLELTITGEPVDNSSCKALSAPLQVLNEFLEEIVPGSTTVDFGDPSADLSTSPFECGVDGVVIRESDNGGRFTDHDPTRV